MKIKTANGYEFQIDDDDAIYLEGSTWRVTETGPGKFYVITNACMPSGKKTIYLHRYLINARRGEVVDHKNGDLLDNRRSNLQIVTKSQSSTKCAPLKNNKSGFRGVNWNTRYKRWIAQICINNKKYCLGFYKDPEKAARVRDAAAQVFHGAFASLNFPQEVTA